MDPPLHLTLAHRSVEECDPSNNVYQHGAPTVTWKDMNEAQLTTNASDCTTYVTALLKQAYGLTDDDFRAWSTVRSPSLTRYYEAAVANCSTALRGFSHIDLVEAGDLFISKNVQYEQTNTGSRGHMMIVNERPQFIETTQTESHGSMKVYHVDIIDVTTDPHSNDDTRKSINPATGTNWTGVGRGKFRVFTDLEGCVKSWSWGISRYSKMYSPQERPCIFAKPPVRGVTCDKSGAV